MSHARDWFKHSKHVLKETFATIELQSKSFQNIPFFNLGASLTECIYFSKFQRLALNAEIYHVFYYINIV